MIQKLIKTLFILTAFQTFTASARLCSVSSKEKYLNPSIYESPAAASIKKELEFMAEQPLAYWYTDRESSMESAKENLKKFVTACGQDAAVIVVYGIPGKDCAGAESSGGFNQNSNSYETFIRNLKDIVRDNSIIILEPDAIATTIDGSRCGFVKGYTGNLKKAVNILGETKAELYVDVGHWVLIYGDSKIKELTDYISSIDNGKIKGISLDLSNYRKTSEMEEACRNVRRVSGKDYKCIIDTSRNNNGHSSRDTWCNYKGAGVGISENDPDFNSLRNSAAGIEHYVWIKPAIELDGSCYGNVDSYSVSKAAGEADIEWFKILWNNGFYKDKKITASTPSVTTNTPSVTTNAPSQSTENINNVPATVSPPASGRDNTATPVKWRICKARK